MPDDQDPATAPMADLSYAIASARAVVMALMARDRDAVEDAALRTCRDCDLLIRLIRDFAVVLQSNEGNRLTCSEAELRWLARRAAYVLTFVGASTPQNQLRHLPAAHEAIPGRSVFTQDNLSASQWPDRGTTQATATNLTVASTGLRVRLVPMDNWKAAASSHDDGVPDQHGSETGHPKPVER